MRRYLLAALFPAGLAAIALATVRAARRVDVVPGPPTDGEPAGGAGTEADPQGEVAPVAGPGNLTYDLARFGAITLAGGVLAYEVMAFVGPPIVNHGLLVDEPVHDWINRNQVRTWAAIMNRFNKVGNTWTTWGAAGTAAACLGVTYPRQKWLPPAALGSAILVDHYATLALRYKFHRLGPPTSPLGTYPSGGCDRVVLFYGLIAHLLWREFSGTQRGKAYSIGTVAALSFIEAYCRAYLSKHWFTDICSGLFYGLVLLGPFVAADRLVGGPARTQGQVAAA